VFLSPDGLDACSTVDLSSADGGDALCRRAFTQGQRRRLQLVRGGGYNTWATTATTGEAEALPTTGQGRRRQGGSRGWRGLEVTGEIRAVWCMG
jgi:hypothetical protein